MKKNLFKSLGLSVRAFADLLLLPEQTVHSWLNRARIIPARYAAYFGALERYASEREAEAPAQTGRQWATEDQARFGAQKTAALKKCRVAIARYERKLAKLQEKEAKLCAQGHLAENLARYLPPALREEAHTQDWLSLLGRRAKFESSDVRLAIHKCAQALAGLRAEARYWESQADPPAS
ncbi:MAG: hypothetical protein OHK0053_38100 [Microscillaceae bacterium]